MTLEKLDLSSVVRTSGAGQDLTVLLVGSVEDDKVSQESVFARLPWPARRARGCKEARPLIYRDSFPVIVSERDLPDGDWKDILFLTQAREKSPLLIVTSRLADESLWSEVLNLGGYDVLVKPFDPAEVWRTVSLAWDRWMIQCEMAPKRKAGRTVRKEHHVQQSGRGN
jgi:DNA-binding response OmpR family regulator